MATPSQNHQWIIDLSIFFKNIHEYVTSLQICTQLSNTVYLHFIYTSYHDILTVKLKQFFFISIFFQAVRFFWPVLQFGCPSGGATVLSVLLLPAESVRRKCREIKSTRSEIKVSAESTALFVSTDVLLNDA